jgi:hypothetical protein
MAQQNQHQIRREERRRTLDRRAQRAAKYGRGGR